MARTTKGPLGNSPRDERDDFVGIPPELFKAGDPPRKSRGPQRVTSNTFHAKVEGKSAPKRADHFRRGGFVRAASGGGIHIKPSHKGLLHEDLGVPEGSPIPAAKLAKAKHSEDPAVRKRATFAQNAKKWNK